MTTRAILRSNTGSASLWQEESYDRIVRDEEHLWHVIQYIGRNPAQAGLPQQKWHRWIAPDWQAKGWKLLDSREDAASATDTTKAGPSKKP